LLVKKLAWDKKAKITLYPHAKRIPYQNGIVVGLDDTSFDVDVKNAAIVDGAIASGSTLMAIMYFLKEKGISNTKIYSVHGTEKSLYLLEKFALKNNIMLTIHITYVSGILNKKFYAVCPEDSTKLIVGDLGDTIADLFKELANGNYA
jgi:phosphoribosylpyrophosphate synthetase